MTQITVPAAIAKSEIALVATFKGRRNAAPLTLAGREYAPGEVEFVGFAGARRKSDGLYVGAHRYDDRAATEAFESADLTQLPNRLLVAASPSVIVDPPAVGSPPEPPLVPQEPREEADAPDND